VAPTVVHLDHIRHIRALVVPEVHLDGTASPVCRPPCPCPSDYAAVRPTMHHQVLLDRAAVDREDRNSTGHAEEACH